MILITLTQVSCGLFYVENVKKINSGGASSDNASLSETSETKSNLSVDADTQSSSNSGSSAYSTGNGNKSGFENENFTDPAFTVTEVIDGDTIDLKNKMRLRLIGINTPEKDMYFYEEAKVFMEILVLGKQVKLEKDVTNNDMYGRYLRYVYLPDVFVNLEMVKSGFANAYTYPPDVKYTDRFIEAERTARENEAGLWQKSPSEVLEVVLNYDAEGPDTENLNGEWAAIKNTGLKPLNLYNWTLKDAGTNIYKFDNYVLEPGETVYLYTGSGTDTAGKLYWNSSMPIWNNEHDTLYIRDGEGMLVYLFNY
ncbi:MAG: thermonuclease family protein [Candidatus Humimicrobiaceae bacterium]